MSPLKERIQTSAWQEKVLCVSIFSFIVFYAVLFSLFNQFPSEYYGGDHYAHFASVMKIYNTHNPFISSHYYRELQHYPWLVPFLIAVCAKVTFLAPWIVAIFFPVIISVAAILSAYWFGVLFFKNKTAALFLSLSWLVMFVPNFHPSEFAKHVMVPLIAVMMLIIYKQEKKSHMVIAGILYGLAGLEHMVTFVVSSLSILFLFVLKCIETKDVKKQLSLFFIVCSIGIAIASLFWLPLLVKYHAHTLNDWQMYSAESIYPSADLVAGFFVSSFNLFEIIFLISAVIVLYVAVKKQDNNVFVPLILFSATLLGIIHPYVTYPLFNISLGYYRFPIVLDFLKHIIILWAVWILWSRISVFFEKIMIEKNRKLFLVIVGIAAGIILVIIFFFTIQEYIQSERYAYAVEDNELIQAYKELNAYIQDNDVIAEDEVTITTHPDFGFFFNAMTGRNVMVDRITHASAFVDPNKRSADMAVILYGTNRTKAKELIEEYNITYGFMERGGIEFKETCLARWNETKFSEKKDKTLSAYWCIQTSPAYKQYLADNGIETTTAYVRLAAGDKDVPLKKVLVIKPDTFLLETKTVYQYPDKEGKLLLKLCEITE